MKKGVLRKFATFTGKHLFLIKLRPAALSKRDCNIGVFM